MSTNFLRYALRYQEIGWHPIPCLVQDKHPWIAWKEFQTRAPTRGEVTAWWGREPRGNIALATGRGMFVIDLDGPEAEALLGVPLPPNAPRVRTGKGAHVYLACEGIVENRARLLVSADKSSAIDIRGDGGYVIAPPSIHPNGAVYEWTVPLKLPLPFASAELLEIIRRPSVVEPVQAAAGATMQDDTPNWVCAALQGVAEGQRDATCARLAGYFLGRGLERDIVLSLLAHWGARCLPPFSSDDVRKTVASIARREAQQPPEQTDEPSDNIIVRHVKEPLSRIVDAARHPARLIRTPFETLNRYLTGGFQPGELIYLGARPGIGKTGLALECARGAAKAHQLTLIVSREMLSLALARRLVAQEGHINASALKSGFDCDWDMVAQTISRLYDLPIWITENATSVADVRAAMAHVPAPVDFVIVDYLQLMRAPRYITDRRLQVESVSQQLKALAMECNVPVLCLSSLSRPADGKDKRPTLASLRESGSLEHDADVVILLHRDITEERTEVFVAKNRDGETGVGHLLFKKQWVSFVEIAHEPDAEDRRYGA